MDIKSLANTIASTLTQPITYGANINEGGGNTQVLQNIQNLGALEQRGDMSNRAIGALGAGAAEQGSQEAAAAEANAKAKSLEAKAAQDEVDRLSDPKNYRAIVNDVGGYDFLNPDGQQISAVDYAKATNKHITDLYKDSQDPNDKDFTDDYKKVLELGKIIQSGDKKARDTFYKKNPEWKKAYSQTPYNDIVKDLQNEYSGYFRSKKELVTQQPSGSKTLNSVGADTRSLKQKILEALNPKR